SLAMKAANHWSFFSFRFNDRGGHDVNLSDSNMERMIEYLTGSNVTLDRFFGKANALNALFQFDQTAFSQSYAILEFDTGGGSHFLPVFGLSYDVNGAITMLKTKEGYSGYYNGQFSLDDIKSVIFITEVEQ
ncbi:MAG: hypothetical protein MI717_10915, partial [Spirochaetales bacterium]|nr:hypothetical protein [Spirochaetales bacterium]